MHRWFFSEWCPGLTSTFCCREVALAFIHSYWTHRSEFHSKLAVHCVASADISLVLSAMRSFAHSSFVSLFLFRLRVVLLCRGCPECPFSECTRLPPSFFWSGLRPPAASNVSPFCFWGQLAFQNRPPACETGFPKVPPCTATVRSSLRWLWWSTRGSSHGPRRTELTPAFLSWCNECSKEGFFVGHLRKFET